MKRAMKSFLLFAFAFLLLGGLLPVSSHAAAQEDSVRELRVMTYNLRYLNTKDASPHTWAERRPTVRQLILNEQPDIFGTQEAVYQQVKDVDEDLPEYDWIGLGREGGSKGEFMAIYFNKTRFSPLEYDHYWLSDTPDEVGSMSWGNTIPRMVTWVKFLDRKTNKQFYFVNTHFDHRSVEAREKSAALIVEKIKEFNPELPVLLTGDFNTGPDSQPHQTLTNEGPFTDLWDSAEIKKNEHLGTFNGFRDPMGGGSANKIDWILSNDKAKAKSIEILNYQKNGQYPSDHYPVIADLTLHY
ncbi:endonuclease/exonuclease/phosphatase family protein [Fictibacillus sp. NRS-1165]|uniref:endonuclease/exonuclease/phosphatase family protein n=1 Tax=Fictibacillus sp. NRS-1165 TaxID=3144463 RepID=UPI003D1CD19A